MDRAVERCGQGVFQASGAGQLGVPGRAPRHVAFAASALFAQIAAVGAAPEKLEAQLDVMAERGDIVTPDFDGTGEAKRASDAQIALGAAGQDIDGAVDGGVCRRRGVSVIGAGSG
ncbi:hypothetical protein [Streptomyces sp. NPDC052012]|uniref:hypothetical protein n=1 Tax=Streptomyces sp. NPDC052012 TaxID=3155051 RepID=UPI00344D64B9